MAFPTADGLVLLKPSDFAAPEAPPRVLIEETRFGGKTVQVVVAEAASGVTLAADARDLEVRFTALGTSAPEQVRFRYRMEGLDRDWIEADTQRVAVYHRLPPGSYRFRVIACSRDGTWDETGDSLVVTVSPYFWETRTFHVASALTGVLLVTGVVRHLLRRRYRRRVEALERQHALERERIAQDIHDDLGAVLTQIGFWSALAARDTGDPAKVREQVEKIRDRSVELVRSLDAIVWAVNPKNDSVRSFVTYLCQAADELFRASPTRCRQDVSSDIPEVTLDAARRHQVFLAAKEALNNAAKHSGATEVWVRSGCDGAGVLAVTVEDNGRGLTPGASAGVTAWRTCTAGWRVWAAFVGSGAPPAKGRRWSSRSLFPQRSSRDAERDREVPGVSTACPGCHRRGRRPLPERAGAVPGGRQAVLLHRHLLQRGADPGGGAEAPAGCAAGGHQPAQRLRHRMH